MRTHRKPLAWLLAVSGLCALPSVGSGCITPEPEEVTLRTSPSGLSVSGTDVFIDQLAPYGQWFSLPNVGLVWQPSPSVVGADFIPYATGGQWVYSDEGWTFETQWDWGWAPFHYGRWFLSDEYGWVWVPGTDWAPAWVDWRAGDGYIGWAPLPPPGYPEYPYWTFVNERDFCQPDVFIYRLPRDRAQWAYHRATPVRDRGPRSGGNWYRGPDPSRVHEATGIPIPRTTLRPPPRGEVPRPPPGREHPGSPPPSRSRVAPPVPRETTPWRRGDRERTPSGPPDHAATPITEPPRHERPEEPPSHAPRHGATPVPESPRPRQHEAPSAPPPGHAATPIAEPPRAEPHQAPPAAPPPPTVAPAPPPAPAAHPSHEATPAPSPSPSPAPAPPPTPAAPPPAPAEHPTHAATPVPK